MTADHDRVVDAIEWWLSATEVEEDPEAVLQRVVTEIEDIPQRRSPWTGMLSFDTGVLVGIGMGAAATLLAVFVGAQLLDMPTGAGTRHPARRYPRPTAATSRSPRPRTTCGNVSPTTSGSWRSPAMGATQRCSPSHPEPIGALSPAEGPLTTHGTPSASDRRSAGRRMGPRSRSGCSTMPPAST